MYTIFHAWIWPAWRKNPILIFSIFIIPTTLIVGQVSIPWFTRELLNALYAKNDLRMQAFCLALTWGLSKLIIRGQIFLSALPISNFIQAIRTSILYAIANLDLNQKAEKTPSSWTQLTIDLTKCIEYAYGMLIWNILPTLGLFILILIEVYRIHPLFFLVYLSYILLQLSIMWHLKSAISTKSTTHNLAKNKLIEHYNHLFKDHVPLYYQKQIDYKLTLFATHAKDEITSRHHLIHMINFARLAMDLIAIVVFILIIVLMLNQKYQLLIGDLSFIIMTLISTLDKAWSLGENWCDLQSAISLLNKHQWLANIKAKSCKRHPIKISGSTHIYFQNIDFAYRNQAQLLKGFNSHIINQRIIGITGLPGSGKSTLMKLIYGTIKPQQGCIYINEINLNTLTLEQKHQCLCLLPQTPMLYPNLSIYENLKLACPEVSYQTMIDAFKLAQCHGWIKYLGIDFLTKDLSSGQKQQLSIARALLATKPIWLMDEALSAIDKQSHQIIMKNLIQHPGIKKIFIVSHQSRDQALYHKTIQMNNVHQITDPLAQEN